MVLVHPTPGDGDDDAALLRAYVQTRSAEAFGKIVERYIGVVHAAALRQCRGDVHAADDVTQIVFLLLSERAARLNPNVVLCGWLVRATYFTALSHRRAQSRRRKYEASGAASHPSEVAMNPSEPEVPSADPAIVRELWDRVRPLLDEAMARLPRGARDALTLRFFEGRTYADVGRRFGISEEAARKRAQRGLASLRVALARRGVRTYDDALEAALGAALAGAAPAALARTVAARAAAAATPHQALVLKGAVHLMAWSKTKVVAAGVLAALLTGGAGVAAVRMAAPPPRGVRTVQVKDGVAVRFVKPRLTSEPDRPAEWRVPIDRRETALTTRPVRAPRLADNSGSTVTLSRDGSTWCARPRTPAEEAGQAPGSAIAEGSDKSIGTNPKAKAEVSIRTGTPKPPQRVPAPATQPAAGSRPVQVHVQPLAQAGNGSAPAGRQ